MIYAPPSPGDLRALKSNLGYTSKEMAALTCIGATQWRRYIGGANPKQMPFPNLFHLAATLELGPEQLKRIYDRMCSIGAKISSDATAEVDNSKPQTGTPHE